MAANHQKDHQAVQDRVVHIARVAKVVKGGRRFSFSALVCVGDGSHQTGFGVGKAQEVPDAIKKASEKAKKTMISVPLVEGTIPYEVVGKYGASRVLMYPASEGKGIIAGSAARMIFDLCGIKNIVCKIHGSRNHHNVVRATMNGLSQLQSIEDYAALRGLEPEQVLQKRASKRSRLTSDSSSAKSSPVERSSSSAVSEPSADAEPPAEAKPQAEINTSAIDNTPTADQGALKSKPSSVVDTPEKTEIFNQSPSATSQDQPDVESAKTAVQNSSYHSSKDQGDSTSALVENGVDVAANGASEKAVDNSKENSAENFPSSDAAVVRDELVSDQKGEASAQQNSGPRSGVEEGTPS